MATMLRVCGMLLQQVLASRVVRSGVASHLIDFILLLRHTLIADSVKHHDSFHVALAGFLSITFPTAFF